MAAREVAPYVHGTDKALDPHVKPEQKSKSLYRQPILLLPKGAMFNPWPRNPSQKASSN